MTVADSVYSGEEKIVFALDIGTTMSAHSVPTRAALLMMLQALCRSATCSRVSYRRCDL